MGDKIKFISLCFEIVTGYQLLFLPVVYRLTKVQALCFNGVDFFNSPWLKANIVHSNITSAADAGMLKELFHD